MGYIFNASLFILFGLFCVFFIYLLFCFLDPFVNYLGNKARIFAEGIVNRLEKK